MIFKLFSHKLFSAEKRDLTNNLQLHLPVKIFPLNLVAYLKYFWFITRHWNPRLAFFTIIQEIRGEKKYGIKTMQIDDLKLLQVEGDNKDNASIYQGANYYLLEKAFKFLEEAGANGHLVDFGSGKGRIMVVAANNGFQQITGIDFAPALCNMAVNNISKIEKNFPGIKFEVLCEDATNYSIPDNAATFFFFNPFNEIIMLRVVKNILLSFKKYPRKIYVVYLNPVEKDIFLSAGFEEEYYIEKLTYLEMSILSLEQSSLFT